jgi:hypothetical protein
MPNTKIGVRCQGRSDWSKKSEESTPTNGTKSQRKEKNVFNNVVVGRAAHWNRKR